MTESLVWDAGFGLVFCLDLPWPALGGEILPNGAAGFSWEHIHVRVWLGAVPPANPTHASHRVQSMACPHTVQTLQTQIRVTDHGRSIAHKVQT